MNSLNRGREYIVCKLFPFIGGTGVKVNLKGTILIFDSASDFTFTLPFTDIKITCMQESPSMNEIRGRHLIAVFYDSVGSFDSEEDLKESIRISTRRERDYGYPQP